MNEWVDVGPVDEFPAGRGRAVDVDGTRVAVFRMPDGWYAIRDACPHSGASLADGKLKGLMVTCFWHGWQFHIGTGKTPDHSNFCARVYGIGVAEGRVRLRPPDEPKPEPKEDD
ncbi:MAG: Rieske 2Fe-2S domain-containing protein, partial [Acidobacteriota bacterium]|nr:Rieske 2Fe-2S domain-containing protein [Acidobacteriota bacterium]